jgi:hypothetical protein
MSRNYFLEIIMEKTFGNGIIVGIALAMIVLPLLQCFWTRKKPDFPTKEEISSGVFEHKSPRLKFKYLIIQMPVIIGGFVGIIYTIVLLTAK